MGVYEKLLNIQNELKCNKNQYNSFGRYNYRNCEDILEALKPLLLKYQATVFITDEIVTCGDRYYIKATVNFVDVETKERFETVAYAREEENKKGMDSSQVTGASSSYARKYALNGMFAIDDNKDSDTTNTGGNTSNIDYRKEFIKVCKEKDIDVKEYAKNNGITTATTQEEYKKIIEQIKKG